MERIAEVNDRYQVISDPCKQPENRPLLMTFPLVTPTDHPVLSKFPEILLGKFQRLMQFPAPANPGGDFSNESRTWP